MGGIGETLDEEGGGTEVVEVWGIGGGVVGLLTWWWWWKRGREGLACCVLPVDARRWRRWGVWLGERGGERGARCFGVMMGGVVELGIRGGSLGWRVCLSGKLGEVC